MKHLNPRALAGASPLAISMSAREALETKEGDVGEVLKKVNEAITGLGKDFEEFKSANDLRLKELKKTGAEDVITKDKIEKIDKSLNDLTEAKAALELRLESEKKEREALEIRLQKLGKKDAGAVDLQAELKSFNIQLAAHAAERKEKHTDMNEDGYLAYKGAFQKLLRKDSRLLSNDEVKILSVGSDPDGGFLVTPDMSGQIVKKVYETSPMRQLASIQAISTDALEGIEDLGEAGVGYAGEHTQGSDTTTPQIGRWRIPVHILDTEPKATQSILDDSAVDVEAWLSAKVADKFGRFENAEFTNGANKIRGWASYPTLSDSGAGVAWASIGRANTGVSGAFAASTPADILFDLMALLKNAYLDNATWVTKRKVITAIRKFKESTTNAYMWQPGLQQGVPEKLLGFPISRQEDVPDMAASSISLAFGDWKQAYQIVDRMGIRVIRDNLTAKPYVKFYTTKRTGGGMLNFEAIKVLQFA